MSTVSKNPRARSWCRGGFTLLELLIVIAIIALLAAMLFPAFASARALARRTACIAQLRQIGLALNMYRQDYENLPQHLTQVLPAYVNDARMFVCPNDSKAGQWDGNDYLEGNLYLSSGVSYQYYPQWQTAHDLNWYGPAPGFGLGKWEDLTPVAGCPWHWAKHFDKTETGNPPGSRGWQLILTMSGAVRKLRVEVPLTDFTPDTYH